ncbi:MAG: PAS domain S-box protein [Cyanobacteria bacterium P01_F01_bin.150]
MTLINPSILQCLTIDQLLDRHPLTVSPDMTIAEVVALMEPVSAQDYQRPHTAGKQLPGDGSLQQELSPQSASLQQRPQLQRDCALVMKEEQLLGIFTKRDLVCLVADGVPLEDVAIAQVMSQPVRTLQYAEVHSLSSVLSALKTHQVHQLPILDQNRRLAGIITQAALLALIDPVIMLKEVERLQHLNQAQTEKLSEVNQQLQDSNQKLQASLVEQERLESTLLQANRYLEERMGLQAAQIVQIDEELRTEEQILARQYQQQQLLTEVTRNIRDSLELNKILETAVAGVRELLECDRVLIIQLESNTTGRVIQEAMDHSHSGLLLLNEAVTDLKLINNASKDPPHTCVFDVPDMPPCSLHTCQWLHEYNVKSCVEVAIHLGEDLWGLIIIVQCDTPRQWEAFEIDLVQQISNQLGIAIAQSQLLSKLEQQVDQRTAQLRQTNLQLEREIEERVNTELELRENQQRLSGILDNADEAIISIDQNQQIVLYNQGAEMIFGYTADEVVGQSLDVLLPQIFCQRHRQYVQTFAMSMDTSRPMAERNRNIWGRRKNGDEFPAEASISKQLTHEGYLFTVMLKDITARQQAEDALRRSEEQLRLTTDALPALICYVDIHQRYKFLNQTYADWFQRPIAELCGQSIREVIGNEAYNQAESHIKTALAGEQVRYETSRLTPDGKTRDLDITYIPDVKGDGIVNGFFSLINDISDRKATERLKDEFVSVVGHELRTPLTSIHGSLKLLATKRLGALAPQGQNIVDIALRNTERLTRLINDVLDLERIQSGRITMNLQSCKLSSLMTQSIQSMQSMAREYDVQLSVTPLETSIWADSDHLTQVLTNLLNNAIKFSNPGDTVWLRAKIQADVTVILVQDQGRGIPASKVDTIFERFQQVDASDSRQRGGTGLGLTICQQIIQQHNGKIWVESTMGKGSTFFFSIPHRR